MHRHLLSLSLVLLVATPSWSGDDKKKVVFKSDAGKFSITLPDTPKQQSQPTKTAIGNIEVQLFLVEQKDRAFVTSYVDYPRGTVTPENRDKVLDGVREGNVTGAKGRLLSERNIRLGKTKIEGREVFIELGGGNLYRGRNFLVGDRLYQIVIVAPNEAARGAEATSYLDSFVLHD